MKTREDVIKRAEKLGPMGDCYVIEVSHEHNVVLFRVSGDHQLSEVSIDEFCSYFLDKEYK